MAISCSSSRMQTHLRHRGPAIRYIPRKKGGVEAAMEHLEQIDICHVRALAATSRTPPPSNLLMGGVYAADDAASIHHRLYTVTVQNTKTGRSWVVHRRYSDFDALRTRLLQVLEPFYFMLHTVVDHLKRMRFPKRSAFVTRRVRRHREECFLAYLRGVHVLLTDPDYGLDKDLQLQCASVLRGFVGSQDVCDPSHVDYFCRDVIPQYRLRMADRKCIVRCGVLDTVVEEAHGPAIPSSDDNSSCSSSAWGLTETSRSEMSFVSADDFELPRNTAPLKDTAKSFANSSKAYAMLFPRQLAQCHTTTSQG
ncbi:hypothetical protein H310_00708 [Aphanomyces invadans]|uniref:PX domain-containing protein n=1 Tax=Aphanomyces invadans TaxID=157072 RepID=A0A024UWR4_9STRA|nr:hypothetical protein H310_00708 [Aphanomyces invadans]ETW10390.1 hypothetical protein H310_00708 [Aphanomyces invadans]|eukprot:XP_008861801.1 hypothetical protein H310_00708 [Aphanomyces invadans]